MHYGIIEINSWSMSSKFEWGVGNVNQEQLITKLEESCRFTIELIRGIDEVELNWRYKESLQSIASLMSQMINNDHFLRIYFAEKRILNMSADKMIEVLNNISSNFVSTNHQLSNSLLIKLEISRMGLTDQIKKLTLEDFRGIKTETKNQAEFNLIQILKDKLTKEKQQQNKIKAMRKLFANNVD